MAFDFLGSFREAEVQALLDFAEDQLQDVGDRISYLRGQIERVGWVNFQIDEETGVPVSYSVVPENSLLSKYIRMYQFYGGDLLNLRVRSRGQWLSFSQEDPNLDETGAYSAGTVEDADYLPNLHYDDAVPAIVVSRVKDFVIPAIKKKREDWEFRIKRTIDLADQHLEEVILLVRRQNGSESLEQLRTKIEFYLSSDEFHSAGRDRG